MDFPKAEFDWAEYLVFATILGLSTLIGVYFGCIKGGQDTISGYLLGGKQMSIFPISMSLIASYVSSIALLGQPTETYFFGSQYMISNFGNLSVCVVTVYTMLPVFYKLQLISLYEYLELRFSHSVRLTASFLYTTMLLTYVPCVIYGAALALNQASGMNIHLITSILCIVCIFYTTLGGLKAVVWSDALQGTVMLISISAVIFLGVREVGGLGNVYSAAHEGDRIEFFNMNLNPTERQTFWTSLVGDGFYYLSTFSVSPATVQRFISLPTERAAKWSVLYLSVGIFLFMFLSQCTGLIIYAAYKGCDPLTSKMISTPDQILPFFVLKLAGKLKGLPGLFLAGVVCSALSTMSTYLNTVSGTLYEDFLEPVFRTKPTEKTASLIMKFLVVIFGIICVVLVLIIEKLGPILEVSAGFAGATAGASLGIFCLGLFFPWANTKGALVGGFASLGIMGWMLVGTMQTKMAGIVMHPTKPMTIEYCPFNVTIEPYIPSDEYVLPVYKVSIFLYAFMSSMTVVIIGLLVSLITGLNDPADVNHDLISPLVRRFLKKKQHYNVVPMSNVIE